MLHKLRFPLFAVVATTLILALSSPAAAFAAPPEAPPSATITRTSPSEGTQFPLSWGRPGDYQVGGTYQYSWVLDQSPLTTPDPVPDTASESALVQNVGVGVWYLHVRSVYNGEASDAIHSAPSEVTAPALVAVTFTSASTPTFPAYTAASTATFAYAITGSPTSVECLVDAAAVACANPFTTGVLATGTHSFTVRARNASNSGQATVQWNVDRDAPIISARVLAAGMTNSLPVKENPATFATSGEDGLAPRTVFGFACFLDGVKLPPCAPGPRDEPLELPLVKRGVHVLSARASDAVGNVAESSQRINIVAGPNILPTPRADRIIGGAFGDTFWGLAGNDRLEGGVGDDKLGGDLGNDTVLGGGGKDELDGDAGNDLLDGGAGTDDLKGQLGRDTFNGGAGNDTIVSLDRGRPEVVNCGAGIDEVFADANDILRNCETRFTKLPKNTTITSPAVPPRVDSNNGVDSDD